MPDSIQASENGGKGVVHGAVAARRLERRVARENLRHSRLVGEALTVLGEQLASDKPRDKRLSAGAILQHYRQTTAPAANQAVQVNVASDGDIRLSMKSILPPKARDVSG